MTIIHELPPHQVGRIRSEPVDSMTRSDINQLEEYLILELELLGFTVLEPREEVSYPAANCRTTTLVGTLVDCEGDHCPCIISHAETKHLRSITVVLGGQATHHTAPPSGPLSSYAVSPR